MLYNIFLEFDYQHCNALAVTLILDLRRSMFMESRREVMLGIAEKRLTVT